MTLSSKDISIIIIGAIASIVLGSILKLNSKTFQGEFPDFILISIIIVVAIVVIVYMKLSEINKELDNQKIEQNNLKEKLKKAEDLIIIRADIKELQKRHLKNE